MTSICILAAPCSHCCLFTLLWRSHCLACLHSLLNYSEVLALSCLHKHSRPELPSTICEPPQRVRSSRQTQGPKTNGFEVSCCNFFAVQERESRLRFVRGEGHAGRRHALPFFPSSAWRLSREYSAKVPPWPLSSALNTMEAYLHHRTGCSGQLYLAQACTS